MCLIVFAFQVDPDFPLIMAANRDEFHTRPADPAQFWQGPGPAASILAGRDRLSGGTWLGVNRNGRVAAVTNIRDPSQPEAKVRSRGELTRDFLISSASPLDYCKALVASFHEFAGYNLIVGDRDNVAYVNSLAKRVEALNPGIYGLSNGQLNNDWPKVIRARAQLSKLIKDRNHLNTDALIGIMADRREADDAELPETGLPRALERKLSSAFIIDAERLYGTRCSTGLIIDAHGGLRFGEQNFDQSGEPTDRHYFLLEPGAAK